MPVIYFGAITISNINVTVLMNKDIIEQRLVLFPAQWSKTQSSGRIFMNNSCDWSPLPTSWAVNLVLSLLEPISTVVIVRYCCQPIHDS